MRNRRRMQSELPVTVDESIIPFLSQIIFEGIVFGTLNCHLYTVVAFGCLLIHSRTVPLQSRYRKLRFLDYMTTAQDGGKVVSLTHRPPLPQEMLLVLISVRG